MKKNVILFLICLGIIPDTVLAVCKRSSTYVATTDDAQGVGIGLGRINLSGTDIQPPGTLLASAVFRFSDNSRYTGPEHLLFECDIADKNNIYEVVATNGDDKAGGYYAASGFPGYYVTAFDYVGIKLTHLNSGRVFERNHQRIPMSNYDVSPDGAKIYIRVKHFSPIRADAIRISSLPPKTGAVSNYCALGTGATGSMVASGNYTCNQPNGYVHFCSPGSPKGHGYCDTGDSASNANWEGWHHKTWMAMSMGRPPISTLTHITTCVAQSVTPTVMFPTIAVKDLEAGQKSHATFNIRIRCENAAISGTAKDRTALGIQVSYRSYLAAQQLNLVNANGGIRYLLSDSYGEPGMAQGVGITIGTSTHPSRFFLGWNRCPTTTTGGARATSDCPLGNNAGWYDAKTDAVNVSTGLSTSDFQIQFNTALESLPGMKVTPGKIDATAYVWVKVQ